MAQVKKQFRRWLAGAFTNRVKVEWLEEFYEALENAWDIGSRGSYERTDGFGGFGS
jgi:hypothetical protein